jgi:hypothetical protein
MRLVAMLCLIAGASSLQLSGMRAAAPSLLASPQRTTRCSLHVMSEAAAPKAAEAAAAAKAAKAENPKKEVAAPRPWNPMKTVFVEQLNAKSKSTGESVIDVLEAIVAKAGEDFKAGLASAGVDFKAGQTESARIIGLAIVSAAALLSSSLSIQFKWTFSALGFASAVYGHIRRALPARCLPAR